MEVRDQLYASVAHIQGKTFSFLFSEKTIQLCYKDHWVDVA
jgi:hypothetical protein